MPITPKRSARTNPVARKKLLTEFKQSEKDGSIYKDHPDPVVRFMGNSEFNKDLEAERKLLIRLGLLKKQTVSKNIKQKVKATKRNMGLDD